MCSLRQDSLEPRAGMVCKHGCKCFACGRRGGKQAKAGALHQLSLWASEHRSVGRLGRYAQQLAAEAAETPRPAKRRRTKALEDLHPGPSEKPVEESSSQGLAKVLPWLDAQWSPNAFATLATLSRSFLKDFALEVMQQNRHKALQVRLALLEQDVPPPNGPAQRALEATLRCWSHFRQNLKFCSSTGVEDFEKAVSDLDHRRQRLKAMLEGS
ncbi:unnamed protein product [Cladocopium goreaui]|uniref:Uncharacterized protein n=1 Tax=Cladocopium goreaui TaxID=2562237 RepID=A0A9P1BXU6_9DINO|nr:unnamed protein product [Cladocopium goreaui]